MTLDALLTALECGRPLHLLHRPKSWCNSEIPLPIKDCTPVTPVTRFPVDVEALPAANDDNRRLATAAESAELRRLIESVLADASDEWTEVHLIACADPASALTCWRALAAAQAPNGIR